MTPRKKSFSLLILFVVLIASCISSICIGAIDIPIESMLSVLRHQLQLGGDIQHSAQQEAVIMTLRLPRMLMGMFVGATLSVAGAAVQGLFRNPLAEPGIIGISSGATLFAVVMIVLESSVFHILTTYFGYYALGVAAFIGALTTTWLVYIFSVRNGRTDVTSLLMIGIAINALVMSFTGLLTYIASDEQLRNITFWSLGSLGGANWKSAATLIPFSIISIGGLLFFGKSLNAIALGESQAEHLGISVQTAKRSVIILAAIGVGGCVAFTGLIGFISLVVPHIIRMSLTGDHKFLFPASALLGAAILVSADLVARTIVSPSELPIGILTAFIGVPVFIYIIMKERKARGRL